jgi:hypothetical protein
LYIDLVSCYFAIYSDRKRYKNTTLSKELKSIYIGLRDVWWVQIKGHFMGESDMLAYFKGIEK